MPGKGEVNVRRYPALYGKPHKLKLRKKRIALLGLILVLLLGIGVGVNTINIFNRMTDRDPWANSLKKGLAEGERINYLLLLTAEGEEVRELKALYFISSHGESSYTLLLPGNASLEDGRHFGEKYAAAGTSGVINFFMGMTGEPVHYYLMMDDSLFASLHEKQGMRNRGPVPYYPLGPDKAFGEVVLEVQSWEREALSFAGELTAITSFWRWPALIKETLHLFETNISWRETTALMQALADYSHPEAMLTQLPPGMWSPPEEGVPPVYMIDALGLKTIFEYMKVGRPPLSREEITVEILNGSGVAGLARRTAQFMEGQGFSVERIADADHFNYERTRVISRLEDVTPAKEVAILLRGAELIKEVKPDAKAMVTIILGLDFDLDKITN
jgi:polyisoprenyl-teichoic acid--peptidoglycan teichoic acid transferase